MLAATWKVPYTPGNLASGRVAARLGGVHEGMTELLGTPCELWVYRRARSALA